MYFLYAVIFALSCWCFFIALGLISSVWSKRFANYSGPLWVERLACSMFYSNDKSCSDVDETVNELIDADSYESHGRFTALMGGSEIWIAGWPYAYGYVDRSRYGKDPLPSRKTRIRLRRYLMGKGVVHG